MSQHPLTLELGHQPSRRLEVDAKGVFELLGDRHPFAAAGVERVACCLLLRNPHEPAWQYLLRVDGTRRHAPPLANLVQPPCWSHLLRLPLLSEPQCTARDLTLAASVQALHSSPYCGSGKFATTHLVPDLYQRASFTCIGKLDGQSIQVANTHRASTEGKIKAPLQGVLKFRSVRRVCHVVGRAPCELPMRLLAAETSMILVDESTRSSMVSLAPPAPTRTTDRPVALG